MRSILYSFVVGLWLTSFSASAQDYHVHTYSQSDGLPNSVIFDIEQDFSGRMWFATRSGVTVYDGLEWRTYSQPEGLPHPTQSRLILDEAGGLWAAPMAPDQAVSRFEGRRWQPLPRIPVGKILGSRVRAMAVTVEDQDPLVALGTQSQGLYLFRGDQWRDFGADEGIRGAVAALAAFDGRLFIGTGNGLYRSDGETLESYSLPSPSVEILGLAIEPIPAGGERLWIAGRRWVGSLEGGDFLLHYQGELLAPEDPQEGLVLEPDGQRGLFIGSEKGLSRLHRDGSLEVLKSVAERSGGAVTALRLDREGHLWVGGPRGVTKVVSFRFANYDTEHGLLEDEVSAVVELSSGEIVLGHNAGLTFLGPRGIRHRPFVAETVLPWARALDLAEDPRGNLWVAAGILGVYRMEPSGAWRRLGEADGLAYSATVRVDGQGGIWAGGERRLYAFREGRFVPVPELKLGAGPRRIFTTRDGRLLVATDRGLYRSAGPVGAEAGGATPWGLVPGLESANVFAFLEDGEGLAGEGWVGTASGLFRLRASGAERVAGDGPATTRPVYFLLEDLDGRLWMGTDNGVLRWNGTRLDRFTVQDGLSGRETNRAAGVLDSRGQVWIGTDQGVSVYRAQYDQPPRPPMVELHGVVVGVEEVPRPLSGRLDLETTEDDLTFRFRALSFRDEKRLLFRSRLEGYEETWLQAYTSPDQEIRYTNLPPGRYRFHLQASGAEGEWSEPVVSSRIVLAAPLWQRWWFLLGMLLLVAMLVYGIERAVAQWRFSGRLLQEVSQRTAELAVANRDLETLSRERQEFLAAAAHDLRVPLVNLRGFAAEVGVAVSELKEALAPALAALPEGSRERVELVLGEELPADLGFIDSSAERMDRLVTAILRLSRLEHRDLNFQRVDMARLAEGILGAITYQLEKHPATVTVEPLPEVTADPIAMEQVLQNLLGNAVAYLQPGRPGRIVVRGRREGDEVIFEVEDNGRGIAPEAQDKVFQIFGRAGAADTEGEGMGLAYVRALLRRHGGRIWFRSRMGEGSVFSFVLPFRS